MPWEMCHSSQRYATATEPWAILRRHPPVPEVPEDSVTPVLPNQAQNGVSDGELPDQGADRPSLLRFTDELTGRSGEADGVLTVASERQMRPSISRAKPAMWARVCGIRGTNSVLGWVPLASALNMASASMRPSNRHHGGRSPLRHAVGPPRSPWMFERVIPNLV